MKKISIILAAAIVLVCVFAGCSCQFTLGNPSTGTTTAPTDPIPSMPSDELDPTEGFIPDGDQDMITEAELQVFALSVRDDILNGKWDNVASAIAFPITVGGKEFASAEEFLKEDWDGHFSETWLAQLRNDDCMSMEMTDGAYMIGEEGNVWIAVVELDDGTQKTAVIAIND